jgi:hypothetical protein
MMPAGIAAWNKRDPAKSGIYLFERNDITEFDADSARQFKRHGDAWRYFQEQPPGYRRLTTHYVISAKRPETRGRRLAALIECSGKGERLPQTLSTKKK